MAGDSTRYEPLDMDEAGAEGVTYARPSPPRSVFLAARTRGDWFFVGLNYGLFAVTALYWLFGSRPAPSEMECAKVVSAYSPVFPAVQFWERDFENGFTQESEYRGPPTRERELAWDHLWHHQGVGVSAEGLRALEKDKQHTYLQTNRSTPQKPEYYALVEMFHHLHCLNTIRQATWPLNMYNASWGEELQPLNTTSVMGRKHVDHCIETLRLSLMCTGDVTPMLLITKDGTLEGAQADFDVHHKCRDYEKIRDFVDRAGVDPIA